MAQPIPELHGPGILPFEALAQGGDERREVLIRKFLPLAAATCQAPEVYSGFMTEYVGDSNPVLRGMGARPAMVRLRRGELTEYPYEVFSGASPEGDLLHVRAAVWAREIEDYRVVISDGLQPASDHRLTRFIINPSDGRGRDPKKDDDWFQMRVRMMDAAATRTLSPTAVPGTKSQWVLHIHGEEPERREAELITPRHSMTFYPIEALHAAILRVHRNPDLMKRLTDAPETGRLTLVHSDQWGESVPQ